VTKAGSDLCH